MSASHQARKGNASARRARKHWMLRTFGNGTLCSCVHCGCPLNFRTLTVDRIVPGASYRHGNIQPSCRSCNCKRGNCKRGNNINWKGAIHDHHIPNR